MKNLFMKVNNPNRPGMCNSLALAICNFTSSHIWLLKYKGLFKEIKINIPKSNKEQEGHDGPEVAHLYIGPGAGQV
jgi:hypothetical protein